MTKPRINELEVKFLDPFEMAVSGIQKEVTSILLKAPSYRNRKDAGQLQRIVSRAMEDTSMRVAARMAQMNPKALDALKDAGEEYAKEKASAPSGEEDIAIQIIGALDTCDDKDDTILDRAFNAFQRLLESGCGSIEGQPMKDGVWEAMSYDDLRKVMGEYCATFLSISRIQKKGGSA